MQITVHTERGFFVSKTIHALSQEESDTIDELLKHAVKGESEYLKLPVDDGFILLGKELLAKTVFVVTE